VKLNYFANNGTIYFLNFKFKNFNLYVKGLEKFIDNPINDIFGINKLVGFKNPIFPEKEKEIDVKSIKDLQYPSLAVFNFNEHYEKKKISEGEKIIVIRNSENNLNYLARSMNILSENLNLICKN
jgi:hypothetical protein